MYNLLRRSLSLFLALFIVVASVSDVSIASAASSVSAPTADKKAGYVTCSGTYSVELSCKTNDAKIYYSTGDDYKLYKKPIELTKNTTIKCYAEKNGTKSKEVSYKYKLQPKVVASAVSGRYYTAQTVTLSSPVPDVAFYYTLDGSKPTKSSKKYSKGITISKSGTLRILAVKSGWSDLTLNGNYTIIGKNSSVIDDYKGKYLYSTLSYKEKQVYERLFEGVSGFKKKIDITDIACDTARNAYDAFRNENPQFFWLEYCSFGSYSSGNKREQTISPEYSMTKKEAQKIQANLEAKANTIVSKAIKEADIKNRAKTIHDELIAITGYEVSGDRYNGKADGPLLHGKARCEGYAEAFSYLAQKAGIDTVRVNGFAARGGHSWNMIRIDNKWYHVDATFDDSLRSNEYFCVNDTYAALDHVPDEDVKYPTTIKYDEKGAKKEFDKFMKEIKANYDKGIMTTRHYTDYKPFGSFLQYTVYNMNSGVWDMGINKRPMYMYYNTWIEITLK